MGRKIPAKKHRGVKDPLVQQAKRFESLKGKINAPPRDPDEQPVPKSLLRLFEGDKQAEEKKKKKLKSQQVRAERVHSGKANSGSDNPVAKLKRLPGESARAFSHRITAAARALHDATGAQNYPVEEEEDDLKWRRRRAGAGVERQTGAQRRKQRLQERKQEQAETRAEAADAARRELVYERLPFGTAAHAPPALPAPRLPPALREQLAHTTVSRPGRRDLLLTRLLAGGGAGGDTVGLQGASGRGGGGGPAEQRRLDAVAAYRALRAAQRTPTDKRAPVRIR